MRHSLHHRLRMARRWTGYAIAVGLVLAAFVVGAASQLLPLAERHPDRIAAWLGERIGRPVAFDRVETRWTRRGPLLGLENLRVGEAGREVRIGDAEMLISQYAGLLPGQSFTELRLRGLDLTLQRTPDGRWEIRGLPGQQQAQGDPFAPLEGLGELQVVGGKLAIVAPALHLDARVPRVDLRLRVDGDRVRVGMRAWLQEGGVPVLASAELARHRGDGRAHLRVRDARLAAWRPLLQATGIAPTQGGGEGEAWATLRGHRVAAVVVDARLHDVGLQGAPLPDGLRPALRPGAIEARARWQATADGWRVDAPKLRFGDGADARVLDGLALAGGSRQALSAPRLEAGPLLQLAALSDRLSPGLREWLLRARPTASGRDVEFAAAADGRLRASGRFEAAGFEPVGNAPGLHGLAGRLIGDARGLAFTLDPGKTLRLDWPRGFGVPHEARLMGTVAGWREGQGWRVGTQALQVRGSDFGLDLRGGLWFQGDGTRPRIDLAADVRPTDVTAARGFWIHHLMPPASVRWLDDALQGGRIEGARALVSGDLDHWPFRGAPGDPARGLFKVQARIVDATLRFHPEWPAAEHVSGDVVFQADGFRVAGEGSIAGVAIRGFEAGIEHFGRAELGVRAQGGGDASRLLALLRDSPLQAEYGATLADLSARGPATVGFGLDLPLHAGGGRPQVRGSVVLAGAQLAEREWKLAFDDVRGRAEYGSGGFVADALSVRHEGAPGTLSLRAGDRVRNAGNAFEARLDATLAADRLLQRVPQLDWLQPHVSGRSAWSAQLELPRADRRGAKAPPGRLRLQSSLAGTALDLPAPLAKRRDERVPATIETRLPLEAGEVRVALGRLLGARVRVAGETGVRIALGSDTVAEPPPASGLVVTGNADTVDALAWIGVAKAAMAADPAPARARPAASSGLALREVDVRAGRLALFGADFPQARLRLAPVPGGLRAQVEGADLAGSVRVPDAEGATVSGRFARLHWRGAAGGADAGPAAAANPAAGDDPDPARLPPLALEVDDLRVQDAVLGKAVLRTQPLPAGLRVVELRTTAPGQQVLVSGDWLGRGATARTRMEVAVDSRDFGGLLSGLGYGGQLSRGEGRAVLAAGWPGGPSAFSLLAMDGRLSLDVRDGQLTEIEPGAGRVLGLLSVAQLPRRLTLDFRDFFNKGFAFDRLSGHVQLASGRARSEDLRISGPAADIRIDGRADLRAQTFDQTIEVEPRTGNLLTVAGALAGGPVGAAIGAAANAVLRKPLGELAARTYRVTGPWKDPHVEVLRREPAATAAADAVPPPG